MKTGLKLNVLFTLFVQSLGETRIFQITSLLIEQRLKLKCSADQIFAIKSEFISFDLLQISIRSFSNNRLTCLRT